jgi:hypothetical protein
LAGKKCQQIFLDAKIDKQGLRLGYDEQGLQVRCEEGKERCDICEKDDIDTERRKA